MSAEAAAPQGAPADPSPASTVPDSTPPRTMAATAATPPDAGADADYDPSQDTAAALATMRAARAAKGGPGAADPSAPSVAEVVAGAAAGAAGAVTTPPAPPAEPPVPVPPPAAPPADEDAKLARVFNRIAQLERERDEARAAVANSAQQSAATLESFKAEARKNPAKILEELGWTQDTLADFVLNGGSATKPALTEQERRLAELEAKLSAREQADQQAEQQRAFDARVAEFKAGIPSQLKDARAVMPHLNNYFEGSDAELADAVYRTMHTAYQAQKTELTVVEAAQAVEKYLAAQAKRLLRAPQQVPASSTTAPAAQPLPPTLTNKGTNSPTPAAAEADDIAPNLAAAAALLRGARK